MPTYDELLAQRQQLASQPIEQQQAPVVPDSLLGKIAVGANAIAQKKDIGQTFQNLRQQRADVLSKNRIAQLGANEQQIATEKARGTHALDSLDTPETKKIQNGYKNFLKGAIGVTGLKPEHLNLDFLDQMSGEQLGDIKPLDLLKLAVQHAGLQEKLKAAAEKPAPESSFSKKQNQNQADTFTKQLEQLPDLNERSKNLDQALAIANKVETGPLAGNDKVYFGQKLMKQDAQRLEQFLSEENVRMIMKFAKEAGVRSIDTEAEQQRLLNSIANKKMSTPVLKETLNKMKRILNDTQTVIRAKQQYVDQHGDLKGFNPEQALNSQIKTIHGVDYQRAEDGKWYPVTGK